MTFVWQTLKQQDGNKREEKQADGSKGGEGVSGDVPQMDMACTGRFAVLLQYSVLQKTKNK